MHAARTGRNACGPRELLQDSHARAHQDSAKTEGQDSVRPGKHGTGNNTADAKCRNLSEAKLVRHHADAKQSAMQYPQRRA